MRSSRLRYPPTAGLTPSGYWPTAGLGAGTLRGPGRVGPASPAPRSTTHPEAASERGRGLSITLAAGISSLQDANDPGAAFDDGRFAPLIEPALEMYASYFAPDR
jgi:hypothetical protein